MNRHPGGKDHTLCMLELAKLPQGARVIDLGAGAGETVELLNTLGFRAEGIDLNPRSESVRRGDLLHAPYPDGCFDAVISQCSFFLTSDVPGAFRESFRLLKEGGLLLYSDVCFEDPIPSARNAGFQIEYDEDLTPLWREYYLEALWSGTVGVCGTRGKCVYRMMICRKERENGSV